MDVKEWSPGNRESFTTPGGPFQAPAGERARSYSFTRDGDPAAPQPTVRREEADRLKPAPLYGEPRQPEAAQPVLLSHDGGSRQTEAPPQPQPAGPQVYRVQIPRQPKTPAAPAPQKRLWWAPLLLVGALLLGLVIGALLYPSLSKADKQANPSQTASEDGESAGARIYREQADAVVEIRASLEDSAEELVRVSMGTGFFIDGEHVLTNYHVVGKSEQIQVLLRDGTRLEARVVGTEFYRSDLALLRVQGTGPKAVTLGDSDSAKVGDPVFTIGHPMGELPFVLSSGYLSGEVRTVSTGEESISMMQINASVNKGNSGGPLFDAQGRVIGIVTAKYSTGVDDNGVKTSLEGLGFAIPINDAMALAESWMEQAATGNKQ